MTQMELNPRSTRWVKWLVWASISATLGLVAFVGLVVLDIFGRPPHPAGYDRLVSAIESKNAKDVQAILRSGVDPNVFPNTEAAKRWEDDIAPINIAASNGSTDIVRLLLDNGADPNLSDGYSSNPLTAATGGENLETMDLLLKRGALINDKPEGSSALWRAAMDGHLKAVKYLLDHGATSRSTGDGSLIEALREVKGSPAVTEMLRARGAGKRPD